MAAEGEVIGGLLPSSPETAFGGTLSEGDWAGSADSMKQEQLEELRTVKIAFSQTPTPTSDW